MRGFVRVALSLLSACVAVSISTPSAPGSRVDRGTLGDPTARRAPDTAARDAGVQALAHARAEEVHFTITGPDAVTFHWRGGLPTPPGRAAPPPPPM